MKLPAPDTLNETAPSGAFCMKAINGRERLFICGIEKHKGPFPFTGTALC